MKISSSRRQRLLETCHPLSGGSCYCGVHCKVRVQRFCQYRVIYMYHPLAVATCCFFLARDPSLQSGLVLGAKTPLTIEQGRLAGRLEVDKSLATLDESEEQREEPHKFSVSTMILWPPPLPVNPGQLSWHPRIGWHQNRGPSFDFVGQT